MLEQVIEKFCMKYILNISAVVTYNVVTDKEVN